MKRDDKNFMGIERVSWGQNSCALFLKYRCMDNRAIKSPLRLALFNYKYTSYNIACCVL
jgi:hypothetical protein